MYLTQIPGIVGDDYYQHQVICNIFPGQKILFQRTNSGLIVLSEQKPAAEVLTKEIDLSLYVAGGVYPFTLRLNPAKRDIKTHKRIAINAEQVKIWIKNQLDSIGVVANFQYIPEGTRKSIKQEKTVSLASVLCFGVFTIKDGTLFQKALANGIGHAKGFGFGMLNVFSGL